MYGKPNVLNIFSTLHIYVCFAYSLMNIFSGVEYIFYIADIFWIGYVVLHNMYGKPKVLKIFST